MPETLVAILLDRSPETVIAVLATVKAGGAWLPIDPVNTSSSNAYYKYITDGNQYAVSINNLESAKYASTTKVLGSNPALMP